MGTNKPVKITDAKSGLIRRLIAVSPSGNKLKRHEYNDVMNRVNFELGAIACHCADVYNDNPGYYDDYVPISMMGASNDFYNFILDSYPVFRDEDGVTLKCAWEMYKTYCEDAKVPYPMSRRVFKEELRNYFRDYQERYTTKDGDRDRSYYVGFRTDKFEEVEDDDVEIVTEEPIGYFTSETSIFDEYCSDCPAQLATEQGTPMY